MSSKDEDDDVKSYYSVNSDLDKKSVSDDKERINFDMLTSLSEKEKEKSEKKRKLNVLKIKLLNDARDQSGDEKKNTLEKAEELQNQINNFSDDEEIFDAPSDDFTHVPSEDIIGLLYEPPVSYEKYIINFLDIDDIVLTEDVKEELSNFLLSKESHNPKDFLSKAKTDFVKDFLQIFILRREERDKIKFFNDKNKNEIYVYLLFLFLVMEGFTYHNIFSSNAKIFSLQYFLNIEYVKKMIIEFLNIDASNVEEISILNVIIKDIYEKLFMVFIENQKNLIDNVFTFIETGGNKFLKCLILNFLCQYYMTIEDKNKIAEDIYVMLKNNKQDNIIFIDKKEI